MWTGGPAFLWTLFVGFMGPNIYHNCYPRDWKFANLVPESPVYKSFIYKSSIAVARFPSSVSQALTTSC